MLPIDQSSQLVFSKVTLPRSLHAEQIHKSYQTILIDWLEKQTMENIGPCSTTDFQAGGG